MLLNSPAGGALVGLRARQRDWGARPKRIAEHVRFIFTSYRELGSLTAVLARLRDCKVTTKPATLATGTVRGGNAFGKGALAYLLKNRIYVGEVVHKGKSFRGEHVPIVDGPCSTKCRRCRARGHRPSVMRG